MKSIFQTIFDFGSDPPYLADPANPESARINGSQALQLVYKYIQKIPVDRFTRLTPVWVTEKIKGSDQVGYFYRLYYYPDLSCRMTCLLVLESPAALAML